jgi:hypothetical protein
MEQRMTDAALGLIAGSRWFAALSLLLSGAAALALALAVPAGAAARIAAAAVLLLGVAAAYLALRLELDGRLFRGLGDAAAAEAALAGLDAALRALGWIPRAKAGRPLEARIAGLQRLTFAQGMVALAQAIILAFLPWLA